MSTPRPGHTLPEMTESPLIFVIVAVQFADVRNLAEYLPKIQDVYRLQGYPLYEEQITNNLSIGPAGVSVRQSVSYVFTNASRTRAVSLTEKQFVLLTTSYSNFDAFLPQALEAFDVIRTILQGDLVSEQLGLRYINALQPQEGQTFDSLFQERLAGLEEDFAGVTSSNLTVQFQGTSEEGLLMVRVIEPPLTQGDQPQPPLLPPDLQHTLKVPSKVDARRRYRLLDIDHIRREEDLLTDTFLRQRLTSLHARIDLAFQTAVSPEALARWTAPSQS